jgi:hypothetical protein
MSDTKLFPRIGLHRGSKTIGTKVENAEGESLGKIEDLVIDAGEGRVTAVILSIGGFLGIGEKLVAIPLSAFDYDEGKGRFVLDIDRETLKDAPAFHSDEWPELIDRVWAADVYTYFGFPPYWH